MHAHTRMQFQWTALYNAESVMISQEIAPIPTYRSQGLAATMTQGLQTESRGNDDDEIYEPSYVLQMTTATTTSNI